MKKSVLPVMLLCLLVAATLFIATSCKSGASQVLPKESGSYIKSGSGSWQKIPQNKLSAWPGSTAMNQVDNMAILIPANCQTITYGYRLLPEEINSLGTYSDNIRPVLRGNVCSMGLAPAVIVPADASFVPAIPSLVKYNLDREVEGDQSKTDTANGYVIIEYQLPPSETGMYIMITISLDAVLLKRR